MSAIEYASRFVTERWHKLPRGERTEEHAAAFVFRTMNEGCPPFPTSGNDPYQIMMMWVKDAIPHEANGE